MNKSVSCGLSYAESIRPPISAKNCWTLSSVSASFDLSRVFSFLSLTFSSVSCFFSAYYEAEDARWLFCYLSRLTFSMYSSAAWLASRFFDASSVYSYFKAATACWLYLRRSCKSAAF